jgi:hypothetical protein
VAQSTEELIGRLAAGAERVRRLRPPALRACGLLLATAAAATILVAWLADMDTFLRRAQDPRHLVELSATLLTGILAIFAAFQLSVPDRSRAWAVAPLPPLALWLATTGYGCLENWINGVGWDVAESVECFEIIVAVSVPLGVSALVMLYRAQPLSRASVAAMGGLGVAAISAFLLQFFHPFDVTVMDLAFHVAAIGLIIAVSAGSARSTREPRSS